MVITITGLPGSGKTTIAKALSKQLGIPWHSIGDLRGLMAKERGMTIDELNTLGEKEAFTDKEVDEYQRTLGQSGTDLIMEGRLSWHFIPDSYKIFLDVDPKVGAQRVFEARERHDRADEKRYATVMDAQDTIKERLASDQRRYRKYYNIDFLDRSNYDLVVDTTEKTSEAALKEILTALQESGTLSAL